MSKTTSTPLVNGWTIFAHPLFLNQVEELIQQVEALKQKDPKGFTKKNASKRLAAIAKLSFEIIPQEPTRAEYRQGSTLGDEYKHWFRAKFFQQYRLFFRYHVQSKAIVYAWVNDEGTKERTRAATMLIASSARCWIPDILRMDGISCCPNRVLPPTG